MNSNKKDNSPRLKYALKLCKYIKGMKLYITASVAINLLFKITPIIISFLTAYMISSAALNNTAYIWRLFCIITISVIFSGIFSYLDVLVSHDMAYRILGKLRNSAYDKINEIAPAAMIGKHSGELTSIVLEDIEVLEWFYAHTISQIIVACVIPLTGLIVLGAFSPLLSVVFIPFIVGLIVTSMASSQKANKQGMAARKSFSHLNTKIVDGVQGLKDIISFQWQKNFMSRLEDSLKSYQKAQLEYAKRGGNENRVFQLIMGIGGLGGQVVAVILVINGTLDLIWLTPIFILSTAIFLPMKDALTMSTNYGMIFGAAKRLLDLFEMQATVNDSGILTEEEIFESRDACDISFEHVSFSYPNYNYDEHSAELFSNLTFKASKGQTVALVGASGSGKTTAVRLLQRFWDVDNGCIYLNGIDIRKLSLNALRNIITVIPQDVYLFNMSVAENIRMANSSANDDDVKTAAVQARADDFIRSLPQGYNTRVGERGLRLSGGEKQRISIAQAFVKNSPVLVLDEASANLDIETERQINEAVNRLKEGRTTLIIAHRISTIRSADRIVVLKNGRIAGDGTYENLMDNCPYFAELIGGVNYGL